MTRDLTVILFDIDGTLIHSGRAGLRGMNVAFERLYGHADALAGIPFAGRTDRAIVGDAMRRLDLPVTAHAIAAFREAYCACLTREMGQPSAFPSGVLPGVNALLDVLEGQPRAVFGLLTGNFAQGAAIKLGHFNLWGRFSFGAFGDDHEDRRALVPVALAAAADRGHRHDAPRVIVIGDTPLDIACAHAHGAAAVAVTTGPFDRAALTAGGADLVVESLEEISASVLERLL